MQVATCTSSPNTQTCLRNGLLEQGQQLLGQGARFLRRQLALGSAGLASVGAAVQLLAAALAGDSNVKSLVLASLGVDDEGAGLLCKVRGGLVVVGMPGAGLG